jgi:hypothetical protein
MLRASQMREALELHVTHRKECKHAKVFVFSEAGGVAAAHDIDHFLERHRVR